MDELRQIFSDKAEVSVIINENMPVMINFEPQEEGSNKIIIEIMNPEAGKVAVKFEDNI